MRERIGLVTCAHPPAADPDQAPLARCLRERGLEVGLLEWDGPSNDAGGHDLCLLKSCWNYHLHPQEFSSWLDDAARRSRLFNPLDLVRWNFHKRYLADLRERGVPVVPTVLCGRHQAADLHAIVAREGWREFVVKPAISASSHRTRRFGAGEVAAAQSFLDGLLEEGDGMVQPYLEGIESSGERSLTWVDGVLTHAVRRGALLAGRPAEGTHVVPIAEDEAELALRAVSCVPGEYLYARIDLIRDPQVGLVLSELELIEPLLHLHLDEPALERFADAVAARAGG